VSSRGAFRTVSYFGMMHLNYGKVATLFEVQSGSMFVSGKTARLGSEESSVPEARCDWHSQALKSSIPNLKPAMFWSPVVQRIERRFPKTRVAFRQQSSSVVPSAQINFVRLYWTPRRLTSSGICPFLTSPVTQRVTKLSTVFVRSRQHRLICPLSSARPKPPVFGNADRCGADRTWDRAVAAQE